MGIMKNPKEPGNITIQIFYVEIGALTHHAGGLGLGYFRFSFFLNAPAGHVEFPKHRGWLRAGWCMLAWAYARCSTHPTFATAMPTQEPPLPKKAATEVADSTRSYRGCTICMGWLRQVPRWAENESNQLWLGIACCFAWKGVLFKEGGGERGMLASQ